VSLKASIAKYVSYKPNKMISAYRDYVMFQYFLIYFRLDIQDTVQTIKAVGYALPILLCSYWNVI